MSDLFEFETWCKTNKVKTRLKRSSFWVRLLGKLCRPIDGGLFMRRVTTIGSTIWLPDDFAASDFEATMNHELVHVKQFAKYGLAFLPLYLFFPLPIFLSYWRWKFEREAYVEQLRRVFVEKKVPQTSIDYVVDVMWSQYAKPWPKSWMREWFKKELHGV